IDRQDRQADRRREQAHPRAGSSAAQAGGPAQRAAFRDRAGNRLLRQVLRAHGSHRQREKSRGQRDRSDRRARLRARPRLACGARHRRHGARRRARRPPARGVAPADGRGGLAQGRSRGVGAPAQMNLARDNYPEIRDAVRQLCSEFDSAYWQKIDEKRAYPEKFVEALTKAGWMSALIPEEYGGSGLSLTEATVIMEEVTRSGGNAGCCHGQMYNMDTLLRNGSPAQKKKYLPKIASGELRLQAMGVTEPGAGTDTTKIKTFAVKKGDRYVVNGQK